MTTVSRGRPDEGARLRTTKLAAVLLLVACGGTAKPEPTTKPTKPGDPKQGPVVPTGEATTWDKLEGPIAKLDVVALDPKVRVEVDRVLKGQVGKPLDRRLLRTALDEAMRIPGVAELGARGTQLHTGILLTVDVTPHPTLHDVKAHDSTGRALKVTEQLGDQLDPHALDRVAERLASIYLDDGYYSATATWHTVPVGTKADVVVEVHEGPQLFVGDVKLAGNTVPAKALLAVVGKTLATGSPVTHERLNVAVLQLNDAYYDRGYIEVKVSSPELSGSGKGTLVFKVEEGLRYKLGTVELKPADGIDALLVKRYAKLLAPLKKGDIFNRSAVAGVRDKLVDALHNDGMPNGFVNPSTNVDREKRTISMTFELVK